MLPAAFIIRKRRAFIMIAKRGVGDFPRMYRPCRLSEFYGQNEIKDFIKKSFEAGALPKSSLFYGPSDTGKA
jgi:Holliday junction resolvasome RuvABC ATP-dependent DNA helicase subunit